MKTGVLLLLVLVGLVATQDPNTYPVPIPAGGRNAVHGWLILPFQDQVEVDPSTSKPTPVRGWFFHHVSEFPADSPHNFHIMVLGEMQSLPHAGGEVAPLAFPIPPVIPPYRIEWTFTPPPSFSLNDLLSGSLTRLNGPVYNGSFDTPYERIPTNLATLQIFSLTTAVWLNSSDAVPIYDNLQFFSYPFIERKPGGVVVNSSLLSFYFAHELNAPVTDYDQIVWMTIDTQDCQCECVVPGCECPETPNDWFHSISEGGQRWIFPDLPNYPGLLESNNKLTAYATNSRGEKITCGSLVVQEELHCMYGPLFNDHCTFNTQ